jgi:hypothetical protein
MSILLVEPEFPIPPKSKNHSNFLPIGLLKLANYYWKNGNTVQLIRGNAKAEFYPKQILITSLFTYWSKYVKDSVAFYRNLYPKAKIIVGGIYASLMPEHCKNYTGCDEVFIGIHHEAENCQPAYDMVDVDYQIIHGMRGCTRKCPFCGIWKLEKQQFKTVNQIRKAIIRNKLVFYDNNMLINPNIRNILKMLKEIRINGKYITCECQSGFDGRIIAENQDLAFLLKQARFTNIRLAWDFSYEQYYQVENWINIFKQTGYNSRSMFIFMIYNWSFDYEELEKKRQKCYEWGIQISDCRFRPLNQTFDNYDSHSLGQTAEDYYIHSNWTDEQIRQFRRNVRRHNICIRQQIKWDEYSKKKEKLFAKSRSKAFV